MFEGFWNAKLCKRKSIVSGLKRIVAIHGDIVLGHNQMSVYSLGWHPTFEGLSYILGRRVSGSLNLKAKGAKCLCRWSGVRNCPSLREKYTRKCSFRMSKSSPFWFLFRRCKTVLTWEIEQQFYHRVVWKLPLRRKNTPLFKHRVN